MQKASAPFSVKSNFSSTTFGFARLPISRGMGTRETYTWYYGTCTRVEMRVQILEMFQGVSLVLLTET
jgi:hypothetical protein